VLAVADVEALRAAATSKRGLLTAISRVLTFAIIPCSVSKLSYRSEIFEVRRRHKYETP